MHVMIQPAEVHPFMLRRSTWSKVAPLRSPSPQASGLGDAPPRLPHTFFFFVFIWAAELGSLFFCPLQAQFLNLLLCRCFQLAYLEKHPEEGQEGSPGAPPQRNPSLLNHGFPLSVSALVSFRRAPFLGLLPGSKVCTLPPFQALNVLA